MVGALKLLLILIPPINQCSHVRVRHWAHHHTAYRIWNKFPYSNYKVELPSCKYFCPCLLSSSLIGCILFLYVKLTLLFISPCLFWHISILRDSSELSIEILNMIDTYYFQTTLPSFLINHYNLIEFWRCYSL